VPPGKEVVVLVFVVVWGQALSALSEVGDLVLLNGHELIWLVSECSEGDVLANLASLSVLVREGHVSVGIKSERIGPSVPDEDSSPVFDSSLNLGNKLGSVGLLGSEEHSLLLSFSN